MDVHGETHGEKAVAAAGRAPTVGRPWRAQAGDVLDRLPVPVLGFTLPTATSGPLLVGANLAAGSLLGRDVDDLLGDAFWEHVIDEERLAFDNWFARPTIQPARFGLDLADLDGSIVRTEVVAVARSGSDGQLAFAELVLHDLAVVERMNRSAAERDARRLASEGETADAAFHLRLWPRLGIVWANEATGDVFGLPVQQLLDKPSTLFDAVHAADLPNLEKALQEAVGGAVTVRFRLQSPTGERHVELDLRPQRGSVHEAVILLASARSQAEDLPLQVAAVSDAGPRLPMVEPGRFLPVDEDGEVIETAQWRSPQAEAADAAEAREVAASLAPPVVPAPPAPEVPSAPAAPTLVRDPAVDRRDVGNMVASMVGAFDIGSRSLWYQGETGMIEVDQGALEKAINAALENARRHTPAQTKIQVTVARSMAGVLVTIRDNGPGMEWPAAATPGRHGLAEIADLAPHCGNGMKLLAAVAERHNGSATIQVVPGMGTTIRLLLHGADALMPKPAPSRRAVAVHARERTGVPV